MIIMFSFHNNPEYTPHNVGDIIIYTCTDPNGYHMTRYVEAQNQQIFASCGFTKEKLQAVTDEIIKICNDGTKQAVRTDVAALANMLQYCMQYPLEENCALKMGCVLSFIDGEDPNKVHPAKEAEKLALALNNPEAYTFFLSWGLSNIPEYRKILDISTSSDYLVKRKETMRSLLPDSLRHIA